MKCLDGAFCKMGSWVSSPMTAMQSVKALGVCICVCVSRLVADGGNCLFEHYENFVCKHRSCKLCEEDLFPVTLPLNEEAGLI